MYVPRIFKAPNSEVVADYIRKNSFATLVSAHGGSRIIATHIPLLLQQNGNDMILSGHLSIANEQCNAIKEGDELLAIFMQHHAYISSSWYDHINVPTWNYIAVHVYGRAKVLSDEQLYSSIERMVDHYEHDRNGRFHLHQFEQRELQAHLNGIVGFSMSMDDIQAAYKLSQNRKDQDYQEIIRQLETSSDSLDRHIAAHMKSMRP